MTFSGNFGPGVSAKKVKLIDGEDVLRLWITLGSIGQVIAAYKAQGKVNSFTGKSFTREGLTAAAYRYVLFNVEEAKEKYFKPLFNVRGDEWNEDWYRELLVRRANQYLYKDGKAKFLKRYNLEELARTLAKTPREAEKNPYTNLV